MADTTDITALDDEAFMEQWTALGKEAQDIKARLTAFSQEHQRRTRLEQLRQMDLSDADMALLQSAGPVGIESEEQVNTDG